MCWKQNGILQFYRLTEKHYESFTYSTMARQVHNNSLNLSLNFKPRFENLKPINLGLKEKVHNNSSNQCLKFQTLNLCLKILNLGLKEKVHINLWQSLHEACGIIISRLKVIVTPVFANYSLLVIFIEKIIRQMN